jgi:hypothetical protein
MKKTSILFASPALAVITMLLVPAFATTPSDLRGQWVGNSTLDGGSSIAKTTLSLGAPDKDDSALRIEGNSSCVLGHGSYAAGSGEAWSLTFKDASGGALCERLAKGSFTVRPGSAPRSVEFEAAYPNSDGGTNRRSGILKHYP